MVCLSGGNGIKHSEAPVIQSTPVDGWMRLLLGHFRASLLLPLLLLPSYSGSGSGRQILYCYVMNIFPPRPDPAEKAVSSVQRLIIGRTASPAVRAVCGRVGSLHTASSGVYGRMFDTEVSFSLQRTQPASSHVLQRPASFFCAPCCALKPKDGALVCRCCVGRSLCHMLPLIHQD